MAVDKLVDSTQLDSDLTSVANAIRTKGGTSGQLAFPAGFVSAVNDIQTGGVEVEALTVTQSGIYTAPSDKAYSPVTVDIPYPSSRVIEKDVNFYDYNAKLLYSYTAQEIQAMNAETDLPPNPTHAKLVSKGWNWTLAEIKSQLTNVPGGVVNVGQMYNTPTGATEIDIILDDPNYLSPYLVLTGTNNKTAVVDWGDNSSQDTIAFTGTSNGIYTQHIYQQTGEYTISIMPSNGCKVFFFSNAAANPGTLHYATSGDAEKNKVYGNKIRRIRFGTGMCSRPHGLRDLKNLETVSFSDYDGIEVNSYMMTESSGLMFITFPRGFNANAGGQAFETVAVKNVSLPASFRNSVFPYTNNRVVRNATIPHGVTGIGGTSFSACQSLEKLYIPSTVTSIGAQAFANCLSLMELHLLPTTPPTLSNENAFTNIQSFTKIYVPKSENHTVLNEYKTASNWSTYADYMQEEP